MQINVKKPRAHVILASSDSTFDAWLRSSECTSFVLGSHALAAAQYFVSCRAAGRLMVDLYKGPWELS